MHYFTVLRRPVDLALSLIRYHHEVGPDKDEKVSCRDLTERLLDANDSRTLQENVQTNFFALYPWLDRQAAAADYDPESRGSWPASVQTSYGAARLGIAKDVLREFLAVGTVERIIPTLDLLRERAAPLGFELKPSQEITLENVTKMRIDDTSWIGKHDSVGRALLALFEEDEALHAYASELLDGAIKGS